jgi:hypothetical protein
MAQRRNAGEFISPNGRLFVIIQFIDKKSLINNTYKNASLENSF